MISLVDFVGLDLLKSLLVPIIKRQRKTKKQLAMTKKNQESLDHFF